MLDGLRQFIADVVAPNQSTRNFDDKGYRLAATALLIHVVSLDGSPSEVEKRKLHSLIESHFRLDRGSADRLIAAFLADRVGAEFDARVSGVTKSGLFVRLIPTGADGFVPAASLGDEGYVHQEGAHALIGRRSGHAYRLGDDVRVRLVEAIPSAGALRLEMLSSGRPSPGGRDATSLRKGGKRRGWR